MSADRRPAWPKAEPGKPSAPFDVRSARLSDSDTTAEPGAFEPLATILPRALAPGDRALERALTHVQSAFSMIALENGEDDPDAVELSRIVARLSGRVIRARDRR